MTPFNRREAVTLIGAAIGISTSSVRAYAQQPRLAFMTAGQGSAFLPTGRASRKSWPLPGSIRSMSWSLKAQTRT
jgi:hypothetical protein